MFTRLLLSLTLLATLAWQSALAQEPVAELDRSRIVEGETVTLSISIPGDLDGEPDLAPLEREFDILDRGQSSHTSIINGRVDSRRVWQLVLAPRKQGRQQIPALQVGTAATRPLQLEVLPAGSRAPGADSPKLFLEVEATPESPYVQQQVVYTIKIFSRVPLRQAGLSEPQVEGALLERLGEDRTYRVQRDGQRYNVIERRYALYPQASGKLTITGPVLSASVPVESRRRRGSLFGRDPFDNFPNFGPDMGSLFQETRSMRMRGKNLELEVQPQPADFTGPWLPAQSLTLRQSWSPDPPEFRVGEPVTRTLTLRARGLAPSQLPDLEPPQVPGLKVYPDQPQSRNEETDGGIEAVKEIKAALVPSRAGRFELPEVRLSWWDTLAGRKRTEVIPARTIEVLPGTAESTAATAPPAPVTAAPTAEPEPAAPPAQSAATPAAISTTAGYWPWIAAALGSAWLLTLALWLWERSRRGKSRQQPQPKPVTLSTSAVERACRAGDPRAAREALLAWSQARWPEGPPKGLEGLAQRLGHRQASTTLQGLDQSLYAPDGAAWDGPAAWRILAPALKGGSRQQSPEGSAALPELYPERG